MAPVGTLFATHSDRIQEVINKTIDFIIPQTDPFFRNTILTSQGVGPVSDIGRDMKILKIYSGGFAGVIEQAGPRGDLPIYGDALNSNRGSK